AQDLPSGASSRIYKDGHKWVEEITGSLPGARSLYVKTLAGGIQVTGGPQSEITYIIRKRAYKVDQVEAGRLFQGLRIAASSRGGKAVFEADWPQSQRNNSVSAEFILRVPRELASADLRTAGGGIQVRDIAGSVEADTKGGGLELSEIGGSVNAVTAGGGINVGNVGGDVIVDTLGGGIRVRSVQGRLKAVTAGGSVDVGTAHQAAELRTSGGSIQVTECSGDLHATTAGGAIEVGNAGSVVFLNSAGGGIRIGGAKGRVTATTAGGGLKLLNLTHGVKAETASGGIVAEFVGIGKNFTPSELATTVGDVVVYLPAELAVTVRALVDLGDGYRIFSDFPELKISSEGGSYGPKQIWAEGLLNGGGPLLKLRTSAGNITIRRGKQQ
ncbi:MAG: hypothetical protein ACRD2R_06885, partial [Terriglobales bacterium]